MCDLSGKPCVSPFATALLYPRLGDASEAFCWLGTTHETRDGNLTFSKVKPTFVDFTAIQILQSPHLDAQSYA